MEFTLALLLYAVLQLIAFLFVLVGTPIDMFRLRDEPPFGNTPCITLWGSKVECYGLTFELKSDDLWSPCPRRRDNVRAAQAFAVISIFVYGLAALFGFIMLCCCPWLRVVCLVLNVTGVITLCIVWASMVVVYSTLDSPCFGLKSRYNFGSGFVLLVFAWCLDIINMVFLLLPSQARDRSENADTKE
ncbi:amastin-like_protein (plasmid) [Leishmania braziliensis MHOM/BR/75/M2904]|uniref:Amastin-like_protein n=1 Tax=Leishmania braziliensis MHOM/BR/75/M2904 TaxID=420245 RepID=A0A3P3YYX4_LEIBR|nr:amastin-like_protein [Leishmania braziliensis MHOM/BR/75/M2904]